MLTFSRIRWEAMQSDAVRCDLTFNLIDLTWRAEEKTTHNAQLWCQQPFLCHIKSYIVTLNKIRSYFPLWMLLLTSVLFDRSLFCWWLSRHDTSRHLPPPPLFMHFIMQYWVNFIEIILKVRKYLLMQYDVWRICDASWSRCNNDSNRESSISISRI